MTEEGDEAALGRLESQVRVRAAVAWLLASTILLAGCRTEDRPPDVVMLVVDTLRADHLGMYGYPRDTSPSLDRFAASAVVFDNVFSTSSWTLPAVASLFTGTYPSSHGLRARTNGEHVVSLASPFTTLAQLLHEAGYRTVAIVTNPWVNNPTHGLDRGFDTFLAQPKELDADELNALARVELERDDPRPLFLYLHYMDVHGPYAPATPDDTVLSPTPAAYRKPLSGRDKKKLPEYLALPEATRLDHYVDAYDIGIRRWDDAFGRLIEWLRESDRLGRTVLHVVADHGEELLDHGGWNHGETLHQEQLHVPWIVHGPRTTPRRVTEPASLIDVIPTLLASLGQTAPSQVAGVDALNARDRRPRSLYAETEVRIGGVQDESFAQLAMRRGDRKWLIGQNARACYDLAVDPTERRPSRSPERCPVEGFRSLESWARSTRKSAAAMPPGDVHELTDTERQQLRELGYLEDLE